MTVLPIAVETITMGRSLTRGAALQYELGLVLQHQYSLVPIVPLNCVRPSAVRGVWVYQTSDMRGLFHLRDVDGTDTWMLPLYQRWPDCRSAGSSQQPTSRLRVAVN